MQAVQLGEDDLTNTWSDARRLYLSKVLENSHDNDDSDIVKNRKRHALEVETGSQKADCPICYKIEYLFRPDVDELHLLLGTPEYVYSLPCTVHKELIDVTLRQDKETQITHASIEAFRAFKIRSDAPVNLVGQLHDSGQGHYGWNIRLLSKSSEDDPRCGRLVESPRIQLYLAKKWLSLCETSHGDGCHQAFGRPYTPQWLVDTQQQCIVPGMHGADFVALSYVWGTQPIYTTTNANLEDHQKPGFLKTVPVARTIREALDVAEKLGKRYCWVDALCIAQDDERTKYTEIENMAAIFAGASLTIAARGSGHAHDGLPGITTDRHILQNIFKLGGGSELVQQMSASSTWEKRAWTFQEETCSNRLLFFEKFGIRWRCANAVWYEDVVETYNKEVESNNVFKSTVPEATSLMHFLAGYNTRDLTFEKDALYAFMGILTALEKGHKGGFICGLPLVFFGIALLWKPDGHAHRRESDSRVRPSNGIASWSWSGWKCEIDTLSRHDMGTYLKGEDGPGFDQVVSPTVQWSYHFEIHGPKETVQAEWYDYRDFFDNASKRPPHGWSRHNISEGSPEFEKWPGWFLNKDVPHCFYRNERVPDLEFWYPVPLSDASDKPAPSMAPFISCQARRAWLTAAKYRHHRQWARSPMQEESTLSIIGSEGKPIGFLVMFVSEKPKREADSLEFWMSRPLEVVELAKGHRRNWDGNIVHLYHVMCIEREKEFACRRGVGEIDIQEWESLELDSIDLTLG